MIDYYTRMRDVMRRLLKAVQMAMRKTREALQDRKNVWTMFQRKGEALGSNIRVKVW